MKSQNKFIEKKSGANLIQKSKTKPLLKTETITPKKLINDENQNYSEFKTPTFNINLSSSNKKNEKKINKIKGNNLENKLLKSQLEEENSYKLLREKYLEYLTTTFDGKAPKITKEEKDLNDNLLRSLAKNEVPIENENLDNIKCSNDMKAFLIESINNFKLNQLKEKANIIHFNDDDNQIKCENKSNLIGLIQLDYGEDTEEKNGNFFEPMELETNNNITLRKSFVQSLRRESAIFLPSVIEKNNAKKASLFK